jgi:DNA-binding ferritin-like protein
MSGANEFNKAEYTQKSFKNQFFSSVGASTYLVDNEKLKATNFMMAGYLLADVLEDIIFPINPEFINSNYYLSEDNYDRLFNCLYFDESKKSFVHRKINKEDISRKYINQGIIDHIPQKFLEFKNKNDVIQTLNQEFNDYLSTCTYYPSLHYYLSGLRFNEFIQVGDNLLKSGTLIFIKNYAEPILGIDGKPVTSVDKNNVKTLKFNLDKEGETIDGIDVIKNKLRFNLLLLDDSNINQMTYTNENNKSKVNVKLIKTTHLNNLSNYMRNNKFSEFLIVDKL